MLQLQPCVRVSLHLVVYRLAVRLAVMVLVGFCVQPAKLTAQFIQLPVQHVFSVDTSVLVPDQGSVVLGGVAGSTVGIVRQRPPGAPLGPLGSTTRRSRIGRGSVTVNATVIDHRAWDQALLAQAKQNAQVTASRDVIEDEAVQMTRHVRQMSKTSDGQYSLAELRRRAQFQQQTHQRQLDRDTRLLLSQGDASCRQGHRAAARIFYRMAWRQSQGELRQEAERRLSRLQDDREPDNVRTLP
jgi:hypothetical protein